jgi:hypothetical protein
MAEMLLTKDHDVIEAIPPDRSDQPLRESICEGLAVGAIAIMNDMARRLTPAASLG